MCISAFLLSFLPFQIGHWQVIYEEPHECPYENVFTGQLYINTKTPKIETLVTNNGTNKQSITFRLGRPVYTCEGLRGFATNLDEEIIVVFPESKAYRYLPLAQVFIRTCVNEVLYHIRKTGLIFSVLRGFFCQIIPMM